MNARAKLSLLRAMLEGLDRMYAQTADYRCNFEMTLQSGMADQKEVDKAGAMVRNALAATTGMETRFVSMAGLNSVDELRSRYVELVNMLNLVSQLEEDLVQRRLSQEVLAATDTLPVNWDDTKSYSRFDEDQKTTVLELQLAEARAKFNKMVGELNIAEMSNIVPVKPKIEVVR